MVPTDRNGEQSYAPLLCRRAEHVRPNQQEQGRQQQCRQSLRASYLPMPQWGHLTLACSRLFPQLGHGTMFPCGRARM